MEVRWTPARKETSKTVKGLIGKHLFYWVAAKQKTRLWGSRHFSTLANKLASTLLMFISPALMLSRLPELPEIFQLLACFGKTSLLLCFEYLCSHIHVYLFCLFLISVYI